MPSPHTVQFPRQALPLAPAGIPGGSHVSPAVLPTMPSPQDATWMMVQSLAHVSVLLVLPSSQNSPASTIPSPHTVQLPRQRFPLAPAAVPGGSHVSPDVLPTMPSPQVATWLIVQSFAHGSALSV